MDIIFNVFVLLNNQCIIYIKGNIKYDIYVNSKMDAITFGMTSRRSRDVISEVSNIALTILFIL